MVKMEKKVFITVLNKDKDIQVNAIMDNSEEAVVLASFLEEFYGAQSIVSEGENYHDSEPIYITYPEVQQ
jgi:hypothetical protein